MFYNEEDFFIYLAGKKRNRVDSHSWYLQDLCFMMGGNPPTHEVGGVGRIKVWEKGLGAAKMAYQALSDYTDYCAITGDFEFTFAYEEHLRQAFEEPVRKKMSEFKNSIVYIPDDTVIKPECLSKSGLTNTEFVKAFRDLQEIVYNIYDAIENTSPFEWGWPTWHNLTVGGIKYRRIASTIGSLANYNELDGDVMVVNRKAFLGWDWNKLEKNKSKTTLVKMAEFGFELEGIDDKSDTFKMSCTKNPYIMRVIYSFDLLRNWLGNHMDYSKIQDPATLPTPTTFHEYFDQSILVYKDVEFDGWNAYNFNDKRIARIIRNKNEKTLRLWLKNILQQDKYKQEIAALPSNIKSKFKRRTRKPCPCGETMCYKDERNEKAFEYEYEGKQYDMCEKSSFVFKDLDVELIPTYLRLLELEYGLILKMC